MALSGRMPNVLSIKGLFEKYLVVSIESGLKRSYCLLIASTPFTHLHLLSDLSVSSAASQRTSSCWYSHMLA